MICPGPVIPEKKREQMVGLAARDMQYEVGKSQEEKGAGSKETFKTRTLSRRQPEYDAGQYANQ